MNKIKFSIVLDHKQDVFREIEIDDHKKLEDLHQLIVESFNLRKEELAAFYLTDEDWNQEDEIPLISIEVNLNEMKDIIIKDIFKAEDSRLLYVNDFLLFWRFMVSVEQISECNKPLKGKTIISFGEMPSSAPNVQFVSDQNNDEDDLDDEFGFNEFEEFNEHY